MLKKIVLVVIGLVFMSGIAFADAVSFTDYINKIPALLDKLPEGLTLREGVGWDFINGEADLLSTVKLVNWKGFALEVGHATTLERPTDKNKVAGAITHELMNLKDKGVNIPVLDKIQFDIGGYATYNTKFGGGICVTGILKFD